MYLTRVTLAGVSYVSNISHTVSQELIWEGGPITRIVVGSDGNGVTGITMEGYNTTSTKDQHIHAQWYKSIEPRDVEKREKAVSLM